MFIAINEAMTQTQKEASGGLKPGTPAEIAAKSESVTQKARLEKTGNSRPGYDKYRAERDAEHEKFMREN